MGINELYELLFRLGREAAGGCVQCQWGYEPQCVTCTERLRKAAQHLYDSDALPKYGCEGRMP